MRFDALPTLETKHLILRPLTMADAPDIFAYAQDPEVSKLLTWYPPNKIEETKELIKQWILNYQQNKSAPWGIVYKTTTKVIGTIDVHDYNPELKRAEIGYCLARPFWGKGLMVEAVKAVVEYLFTQTNTIEVIAFVRTDNPQSARVLQKAGFEEVKDKKLQKQFKGVWVDVLWYKINKKNYI